MNDDRVRQLLEKAGPRPDPPPEDLAAIQAAFRSQWQEHVGKTRRTSRSPWMAGLAAAAVLLVGIGLWWWSLGGSTPATPIGRMETLEGTVTAGSETRLSADDEIPAGTELVTEAESGAGLRLANGTSLRLDSDTRVLLVSPSSVELERGAVYADTGSLPNKSIQVSTPFGTATDVGTRFEVRLLEDGAGAVRVRVREGLVRLEAQETRGTAEAGVELTLFAGGNFSRADVAPWDPSWAWVMDLAPPFELEGRTLDELLHWVARETGWTVRYADPELEASAGSIVLHGSTGGLTPDQAPDVVLPGAGLEHEVVDGTLVVREP